TKQVPVNGWVDLARLEIQRQLQKDKAQRDWSAAERALQQASRSVKRSVEITMLRSEVLVGQDRAAEAEQLLEEARAEQEKAGKPEKEAELWAAQADLATRLKDRPRALEILGRAEKKLGDRAELRLARARAWSRDAGPEAEKALRALEQGVDDEKK